MDLSVQAAAVDMKHLVMKKTNVRYVILAMLFIVTTFNYIDRATLSIAAPQMQKDLGINAVSMGLAFSAFGWAYTGFQIPVGMALDKWGTRVVNGIGLLMWSVFTFLQGFSTGITMLFLFRFMMGTFEAPAFPANSRIAVSPRPPSTPPSTSPWPRSIRSWPSCSPAWAGPACSMPPASPG